MMYYPQDSVCVAALINIDCYGTNPTRPLINLIVNQLTTTIESYERNQQFTIYPNPAGNQLSVVSKEFTIKGLKVYSMLGELVFDPVLSIDIKQKINLNVSSLTEGVYFLKIETQAGVSIQKFIKE